MKRKIVKWTRYDPPPAFTPVLECGHKYMIYDADGLSAETKAECERNGNVIDCVDCGRAALKIRDLEKQLEEARSVLRHGEEP